MATTNAKKGRQVKNPALSIHKRILTSLNDAIRAGEIQILGNPDAFVPKGWKLADESAEIVHVQDLPQGSPGAIFFLVDYYALLVDGIIVGEIPAKNNPYAHSRAIV